LLLPTTTAKAACQKRHSTAWTCTEN